MAIRRLSITRQGGRTAAIGRVIHIQAKVSGKSNPESRQDMQGTKFRIQVVNNVTSPESCTFEFNTIQKGHQPIREEEARQTELTCCLATRMQLEWCVTAD